MSKGQGRLCVAGRRPLLQGLKGHGIGVISVALRSNDALIYLFFFSAKLDGGERAPNKHVQDMFIHRADRK